MQRFNISSLSSTPKPISQKNIKNTTFHLDKSQSVIVQKRYVDVFGKPAKGIQKMQWIRQGLSNLHQEYEQILNPNEIDVIVNETTKLFETYQVDHHSFSEAFCCFVLVIKIVYDENLFDWQYKIFSWGAELCSSSVYHLVFIEKQLLKKIIENTTISLLDTFM